MWQVIICRLNNKAVFLIFCICLLLVEMLAFYSPLYYLSYCVLHIDRKIGDNRLATILSVLSVILSILFFPWAAELFYWLIHR